MNILSYFNLCEMDRQFVDTSTDGIYSDKKWNISWVKKDYTMIYGFDSYYIVLSLNNKINNNKINIEKKSSKNHTREFILHWNRRKHYCCLTHSAPWNLTQSEKDIWYKNVNNRLSLNINDYKYCILNIFKVHPTYDEKIITDELEKYLPNVLNDLIKEYMDINTDK